MPIRVVIADDHLLVREGVRQLLRTQADIEVIGEAADGMEALELTRSLRPEVLVLDIGMPRLGGIESVKLVRSAVPETKIVMLTMFQTDACAHQAQQAGAHGYVLKGAPSSDLLQAIRTVHAGGSFLGHTIRAEDRHACLEKGGKEPASKERELLSEPEKQVFLLLLEGKSNPQIGTLLGVSTKTVKKHRASITRKIGVSNPVEMIQYAIRGGIINPDFWRS